jgi:hypothetical protein
MLRLFQSIFGGGEEAGRYPETLVRAAIERAVDSTDPWLRGLTGYRRKLRPAVLTAIDHVVALVNRLPPPRPATRDAFGRDPLLQAIFLSSEQMRQVLHHQVAAQPVAGGAACALLVMNLEQRGIFGVDLLGDTVVHDVPQVTVSFANHRLFDPTGSEDETRRRLKRRAFDHLLSLALRRMVAVKEIREGLDNRRTLLQAKLDVLQRGDWGFDLGAPQKPANILDLETQLNEIEAQLQRVGSDDQAIEVALGLLADVLGRPQEHLLGEKTTLVVDRMGIKRAVASDEAPELVLDQLHNAEGRSLVATLITLAD